MSEREFPKTYLEFEGKKTVNGKKRQYWVQDATEDYFKAIEGVLTDFLDDEPINKYGKINEDPQSVGEFQFFLKEILATKCSLICLTKDDDNTTKLAGFNILYQEKAGEEIDFPLQGKCSSRVHKIAQIVEKQRNIYEEFNLPRIMKATGLYVLPDFRGEGLGDGILKAREYLCRHLGIKGTLTVFTSIISQKIALRTGFQEYSAMEYEELFKMHPSLTIPDIQNHTKILKCMYQLYN